MSVLTVSDTPANMHAVVRYASSLGDTLPFSRQGYFAALNRLQGFRLAVDDGRAAPRLVFELTVPDTVAVLKTLQSSDEFRRCGTFEGVPPPLHGAVRSGFDAALATLDASFPAGAASARSLIGMALILRAPGYVGGSFWHLLGGVWFSPSETWTVLEYASNLLHESVHQAMFLDDMVNRLFTAEPDRLSAADAQVVSSIRRTSRPLHYAFHAATVAAVLAEFYSCMAEPHLADQLRRGLAIALPQLDERRRFLSERGNAILDAMLAC